jgi:hypothetical protein
MLLGIGDAQPGFGEDVGTTRKRAGIGDARDPDRP